MKTLQETSQKQECGCGECGCGDSTVAISSRRSMLAYEFDPLIHRMVDKHGWTEEDAHGTFEDMKRFLFLAAETGKPVVPTKKIDEIWHDFILFTEDYEEFCLVHAGRFLHHRPRRRDDPANNGSLSRDKTIELAHATFGELSANWNFTTRPITHEVKTVTVEAGCSCSSWCQCS